MGVVGLGGSEVGGGWAAGVSDGGRERCVCVCSDVDRLLLRRQQAVHGRRHRLHVDLRPRGEEKIS